MIAKGAKPIGGATVTAQTAKARANTLKFRKESVWYSSYDSPKKDFSLLMVSSVRPNPNENVTEVFLKDIVLEMLPSEREVDAVKSPKLNFNPHVGLAVPLLSDEKV